VVDVQNARIDSVITYPYSVSRAPVARSLLAGVDGDSFFDNSVFTRGVVHGLLSKFEAKPVGSAPRTNFRSEVAVFLSSGSNIVASLSRFRGISVEQPTDEPYRTRWTSTNERHITTTTNAKKP